LATVSQRFLTTRLLAFTIAAFSFALLPSDSPALAQGANQQAARLNNEGVKALNAGDFDTAIRNFQEALKVEPSYSYARDNLAVAYNNKALKLPSEQAIKYFHLALATSPKNATTSQNLDEVIKSLGKDPNSFKDREELGKQCRLNQDFDGAIVEFQAALRIKNDGKLHAALGDVLRVRDRVDEAVQEYRAALSAGGMDPADVAKTNVKLGQAYQAKKDLKDAILAFGDAIKYKSDDPDVLDALKVGWEEALRENPQAPENHIGLGQAMEYANDFGQAEAEYRQALRFDPSNAIARRLLSELPDKKRRFEIDRHINAGVDLQQQGNLDGAIKEYMVVVSADPGNVTAWVNIGSALQQKKDYARAIAAYKKVQDLQPGNKAAEQGLAACQAQQKELQMTQLTQNASDAFKAGRYADALKMYQEVEEDTPKDAAVHFNIGAALQQLNRIDDAIAEYKQAVNLDQKNAEYKQFLETALDKKAQPIIDQAVAAHKKKDYMAAVDLYQQALGIRPKKTDLYYDLASAFYSLQSYDQAKTNYQKAVDLDPKGQVGDLWFLGKIAENSHKGYDAMDFYKKYLAQAPGGDYAKAAHERIDALMKDPNATEKIKSESELNAEKDATDAYQAAFKLLQNKQYDEAMPLIQKAMQLQPKESSYVYAMSTLYFQKGELEQAAGWVDKALAMDPKNKDYLKQKQFINDQRAEKLVNDAVAKQNAEDYKGAISLYEQALQLVPKNARVWTNTASAYYALDDFNDAYIDFKKALDLDAQTEKLNWYSLAAIDDNFGRGKQALDEYNKFVSINPGDSHVSAAQERMHALAANPGATKQLPTHSQVKNAQAAQAAYDQAVKLQQGGQLDEAAGLYMKAAQLNPSEGAYQFALGSVYQAKKDTPTAISYYEKALALSPKNADFKKYLEAAKVDVAAPLVDAAAKKYTAGDYAGAIDLYRQALQTVPNDASVHTDVASALQANDDFQGALQEYEKAYQLDPKGQAEVQYFIGALKENFNRGGEALQNYREYVSKNPGGKFKQYATDRMAALSKNAGDIQHLQTSKERASAAELQQLFDEAVKLQQAGKFADAESRYAELMQKNPSEGAYPYARGTNFQQQNDMPNAIDMYKKAVAIDPKNNDYKKALQAAQDAVAGTVVQQATEKFAAKDYSAALELYKQALAAASPQSQANIHTNIAICLQYMDQFQAARDEYAKGYDMDPKGEVDNLYFMGPLDETLNKGKIALGDYTKYLQYAPKGKYAPQANARYQELYYNPNKVQKMQTQAEIATQQAAGEEFNDAVKLQGDGKLDEALAKYDAALARNPNSDSVWYSKGTCLQAKNDLDGAIKCYQKAVALNPKEPSYKKVLKDAQGAAAAPYLDAAYKKQTTKDEKGEFDLPGAISQYELALKIDDDPGTHMNLGTAYQANKMYPKAVDEYLRAIQGNPKLCDAYYYLGTCYEQMNKGTQAAGEYRRCLQCSPSGANANEAKARLKVLK
jgi:tetratricopeptide (TPR) repeat protein